MRTRLNSIDDLMGPHDSQSSRENANPSSGTSPLASNKKVPPLGQAVYEKIKITSKQKTVDYRVSIAQLRVVSPFRLGNSIAGSLMFRSRGIKPKDRLFGYKLIK